MPLCRALIASLLILGASSAGELTTLKNEAFKGDLVGVTDKDVVFQKAGGEKVTLPITEVMRVDLGPEGKVSADAKYADVELNDGTVLKCASVLFKGGNAELTLLLAGQKVEVPIKALSNVLFNGQVEKNRKEWGERLQKKRKRDGLAKLNQGTVNLIEGTIGEGDAEGKSIDFIVPGIGSRPQKVEDVFALVWAREPDPLAAPAKFKLLDAGRNIVFVLSVQHAPEGLTVTTPSGVKLKYPMDQVARLDYSFGNLTYLSDMEPVRVVQTSTEDRVDRYRRDKNLDDGPIRLRGEVFAKGLALHAYTELEYDLKGDFREFRAVIGIDDEVRGIDGPTLLLIEGTTAEGQPIELLKMTLTRKDKVRAQPVTLSVKNVHRLRITVSSGDLLDLGKHLDLADAKVTK